ncbi:MAG: acyl-CoA dehydrogenase family protein [Rhodospirillaceae bacterium]
MSDRSFLTWPFFTDAHRTFADDLAAWIGSQGEALKGDERDADGTCKGLVRKLGAAGWLKHSVPDANRPMDVRSLCLMREHLAYQSSLADFSFAMQGLGSGPISLFGSPEQRAAYLPAVAKGERIAAFALSEKVAGSDVASITTKAELQGDNYVLNGEKSWISNGGIADFYCVFARTGEAPGAKGLSAFIVDATTPGFSVSERIDIVAPHPLGTLRFENCKIPKANLIGGPGQGFKIAMATLDVFRSTVAAAALGFARRALDEALRHSSQRQLFGAPLFDLQMMQAYLAEMALDVDASALLVYRAAWTKDSGKDRVTREAAMAKLYATDHAQQVIDKAVQIFGGLGVVSGVPVEKLYREIRALRIYEGASEVQKVVIARQLVAGQA